jgi:hypothetical protein
MKKYTHAWVSLKAVELLKSFRGRFSEDRNKKLENFLDFISEFPSTFVRGAWFPDTVIKDNVAGGHTWKYEADDVNGRKVSYRPPVHNTCIQFVEDRLDRKVLLDVKTSDLADRCEALGQTIRDTILITNKVDSGDVVAFNHSQTALLFLMLSHYICDAHVPVHCDKRDFYTPSKIHPDLEDYWEKEIKKYYHYSTRLEQFDLDEEQNLQRDETRRNYEESFLYKCDEIVKNITWDGMADAGDGWRAFLGKTNNNFWDYLVSVCFVSYLLSEKMFPLQPPDGVDYDTVRIMEVSPFKEDVIELSPYIFADAINSVALLCLAAWERWELLKKGVR